MTAREELAQSIATTLDRVFLGTRELGPATQDYALADALLVEGWGKQRMVATVEELDALPVGSVVVEDASDGQGHGALGKEFDGWVCISHAQQNLPTGDIMLPATVLYEPQP